MKRLLLLLFFASLCVAQPHSNEWSSPITALSPGSFGSWDYNFGGTDDAAISPCVVIKKDGTFFLYYIAGSGTYNSGGGGPIVRNRALGVATSSDGINWTKYSGNPVIVFHSSGNPAEGVFSATAAVDGNNTIILYYGSMLSKDATSYKVHTNIRAAASQDGFHFTNDHIILAYDDPTVAGSGDEIFPLGVYHYNGLWYLWYDSNDWNIYLGTNVNPTTASGWTTTTYNNSGIVYGGGSSIFEAPDIAIMSFLNFNGSSATLFHLTGDPGNPNGFTNTGINYSFPNMWHVQLFRDVSPAEIKWFLYNVNYPVNRIYVRTVSYPLTAISDPDDIISQQIELFQNYPNPFNPTTTIKYNLPSPTTVTLTIYNINGEQVATLVDSKRQSGLNKIVWDASDLPTGIYYYEIKSKNFYRIKQMVLLK